MARINIYITDEMKVQMALVHDRLNWSGIAQRAFERELDNLRRAEMSQINMEAVERLRECKRESEERVRGGEPDGRDWAEEVATYRELRDLARIDLTPFQDSTAGLAEHLYIAERKNSHLECDLDDLHLNMDFMTWIEERFGSGGVSNDWVYHHTKGAQAFYREIKDLL